MGQGNERAASNPNYTTPAVGCGWNLFPGDIALPSSSRHREPLITGGAAMQKSGKYLACVQDHQKMQGSARDGSGVPLKTINKSKVHVCV